jgi:ferrochelatase
VSDTAVVLMAYGSPERLEDVPAYYADIRGGRPIRPERLADLVERYRRLGIEDGSPLNAITEQTRTALQRALGTPVFTGMKHWRPRIADAVEAARAGGATTIVGLVLAPHFSPLSIGGYRRQLEEAVAERAQLAFVQRWGSDEGYVALLADRVRGTDAHVVFTAHSLPVDGSGDYEEELLETARLVAESAGLDDWSFSFQSESPTGVPWLGPDILDHLGALKERGVERVLVCPAGFVADHLEVRWDLDVEAAERARELGLELERIEMPNADARLVEVLAGLVRRALAVPSSA